ncbi:MAG TPA: tRNA pseudouridine(38-40) synthase TruA [Casimicrobiaceae bacterium]|nr:tRNA pseudouridine(38-40) synthase TruA [Casimicrobiaceae bacterium]
MRYALALEYDGGPFCGFQSQPSACAVQDVLERALAAIADAPVRVAAAGRTDAGVHATSQIVHFDTEAQRPAMAWVRGVNAHLPAAAAVLWCQEVADRFHARFAATGRHYTYLLLNRPQRPGLADGRLGWHHAPLDAEAMRRAAQRLLGTHDFSSFRAAECQARTPVKTLRRLDVTRVPVARDGALLRFDLSADAFLHHMVRNIVGALVEVGAGKREPAWIDELLAAADRRRGAPTFSAAGLYFTGADYDAGFGLPATRRDMATDVATFAG